MFENKNVYLVSTNQEDKLNEEYQIYSSY